MQHNSIDDLSDHHVDLDMPDSIKLPHNSSDNDQTMLRSKLATMSQEQLKDLITQQLDLEIRLKHHELEINEKEMDKMKGQMLILKKFLELPDDIRDNELNESTMKYYNILNQSLNATYNQFKEIPASAKPLMSTSTTTSENVHEDTEQHEVGVRHVIGYRTRSTTSSLRPSVTSSTQGTRNSTLGCLYRRTDGVVVRLKCPACQRTNFSSAQGFLNHNRIAHQMEYSSQDAAALKCGELLPEIIQDPTGQASLKSISERGLDPSRNLNIAEGMLFSMEQESLKIPNSPEEKPISPATNEISQELLKKVTKNRGEMSKEEYEKLIKDTMEPISNSHLFEDEEDNDESELSRKSSAVSIPNLKRRVSRGGINIPQDMKRKK